MGKWAQLKDKYPALPADHRFADEGGSDYQAKIDAVKAQLTDQTIVQLGEAFIGLRAERDTAEEALKNVNIQLAAVEQLMLTTMEDQGLSSFRITTGQNFIINDSPHTTVKDRAANRQWFIDHGLTDVLSVPWQTQNAMVKGILEDPLEGDPNRPGEVRPKEMPAGIEIYMRSSIQLRKK
jgi:hypothetical protein